MVIKSKYILNECLTVVSQNKLPNSRLPDYLQLANGKWRHQVHQLLPVNPFNMFFNINEAQRNNAPKWDGCCKIGVNLFTAQEC